MTVGNIFEQVFPIFEMDSTADVLLFHLSHSGQHTGLSGAVEQECCLDVGSAYLPSGQRSGSQVPGGEL